MAGLCPRCQPEAELRPVTSRKVNARVPIHEYSGRCVARSVAPLGKSGGYGGVFMTKCLADALP